LDIYTRGLQKEKRHFLPQLVPLVQSLIKRTAPAGGKKFYDLFCTHCCCAVWCVVCCGVLYGVCRYPLSLHSCLSALSPLTASFSPSLCQLILFLSFPPCLPLVSSRSLSHPIPSPLPTDFNITDPDPDPDSNMVNADSFMAYIQSVVEKVI
jgi:hypothetical protein